MSVRPTREQEAYGAGCAEGMKFNSEEIAELRQQADELAAALEKARASINELAFSKKESNQELASIADPAAILRERDERVAAELKQKYESVQQQLELQRGSNRAQDERERKAGDACGVAYELSGCDWPDAVSGEVIQLQKQLAAAQAREKVYREALACIPVDEMLTSDAPYDLQLNIGTLWLMHAALAQAPDTAALDAFEEVPR